MKILELTAAPKTVDNVKALTAHVAGKSSSVQTSFNSSMHEAGKYSFRVKKCAKTGKVLEVLDRKIELNPRANMFQLAKVLTHELKHEEDLAARGHEFEERDRDGLEHAAHSAEREFERSAEREINPQILQYLYARNYSR